MAIYTASLSQNYKGLANYFHGTLWYNSTWMHWSTDGSTEATSYRIPEWKSGLRTFDGYWYNNRRIGTRTGELSSSFLDGNVTATERWNSVCPLALLKDGSYSYVGEIAYEGGVWYSDYSARTPLDLAHPIPIPKKELYRFVGAYSTNSTSGTKYINADGTPTSAFLALSPTEGFDIYAQFEQASVKITVNSSYGDYEYKTFYQSLAADDDGKYGYYTDSASTPESRIFGIPRPSRELYSWGGLRSSSSTSGTLYANADGTFTQAFLDREARAATVYGSFWTQVSYKITVSGNGGAAPVAAYYTDKANGGIYADWLMETPELQALPIPARLAHRFIGYFSSSSSSGGTEYASHDGTILSALKTRKAATTIYARWRQASDTITLNAGGGTGGGTIYYDATGAAFFDAASATISSVAVPEYPGNTFIGYFTAQEGGELAIDADGAISPSYVPSGDDTLHAQYAIGKSTIDVNPMGGAGGTERFYYDHESQKFYADAEMTEEVASVALPALRLFDCDGLFTESAGGSAAVTAGGLFSPSWHPSNEFETIYAQYTRRCFETVLDASGGSSAVGAIYHAPTSSGSWYQEDTLETPIANVGAPTRTGYAFGGYYYGGAKVVGADGSILPAAFTGEDYSAAAQWTAKTYTLHFNAGAGEASFASKAVTYDAEIGTLPTATWEGRAFDGWTLGGQKIAASTVWQTDGDASATAKWVTSFGNVEDYFNLGSSWLVPIASSGGEGKKRVTVTNSTGTGAGLRAGRYSAGVDATGGVWMNPSVTYMVVGNGTLALSLGKAFPATFSGGGSSRAMTRSGWMITSAAVSMTIGEFPTVTVTGTANEGADAINLFAVSVPVTHRARPQNLLGAVSGGGELQAFNLVASCDPVVVEENMMPCASDVVRGRIEVTATTLAVNNESEPTAGGGFTQIGAPATYGSHGWKRYEVRMQKEIA